MTDTEKRREYLQRHKENKKNGTVRKYNRKYKIGDWKIENDAKCDVAIATIKLKFKYCEEINHRLYCERGYYHLYGDIQRALHPIQTIIARKESNLSVYIKGIDNTQEAVEKATAVIKRYEDSNDKLIPVKSGYYRDFYSSHKSEIIEKQKKYNEEHKEEIKEYKKEYRKKKKNSKDDLVFP